MLKNVYLKCSFIHSFMFNKSCSFSQIDFIVYSLPWNQQTPIGYFYELIFDFIVATSYIFASNLMFIVFISICWFYPAFYKKFQYFVHKMDQTKNNRHEKELLFNLIRFHVKVKKSVIFLNNFCLNH